ncbi:hypothetical protein BKG92_07480 [Rodentibacter ratti]|uniref:Uncharacterized protein n=1 Tax=Rodentibacter ratti TaxID=1906745 RepID=A0A1V3KWH4_9PAST|nr:hypothetical protein [Rodentibacter ratti]OOF81955.1 hypothetical protein BKG92_07480 [Rodentibacter ratti]
MGYFINSISILWFGVFLGLLGGVLFFYCVFFNKSEDKDLVYITASLLALGALCGAFIKL